MKIVRKAVVAVAWILFLSLIGEDCLHWYIIPLSSIFHRILLLGMVSLSSASSLIAAHNLMRVRQIGQRVILKLLTTMPEMETKVESSVYFSSLFLAMTFCYNVVASVWGIIYLGGGPFVKTGDLALGIFVACNTIGTVAGVKLERLKRSMKSRRAKV